MRETKFSTGARLFLTAICVFAALVITRGAFGEQLGPLDVDPSNCPLYGTAHSEKTKALNVLKNRKTAPRADQVDAAVTLERMLEGGDDHGRFDEHAGASIVGYVVKVTQGGHPETANCGSMSLYYTDTHITVGLTPNAKETETLVVEVTPRWRKAMAARGIDWRTETLAKELTGKRVRFTGWLLFDLDHIHQAVNTAPDNPRDWRKTVWEIHPVTGIAIEP